jgi:hypothetical protein
METKTASVEQQATARRKQCASEEGSDAALTFIAEADKALVIRLFIGN